MTDEASGRCPQCGLRQKALLNELEQMMLKVQTVKSVTDRAQQRDDLVADLKAMRRKLSDPLAVELLDALLVKHGVAEPVGDRNNAESSEGGGE